MGGKKQKLLDLLVLRYPERTREELYASVVCGDISVNGERIRDPGMKVDAESELGENRSRFVSRGGEKLEHALKTWNLSVKKKIFIDAGASTGGFSDCLLKWGAAAVHAVDVGYNQIDFSLRRDRRVILHEKTNIMDVEGLDPVPNAAVADLSFRSVIGAAAKLLSLTSEGWAVLLIKPQFEYAAGMAEPSSDNDVDGVLSDPDRIRRILRHTLGELGMRGVGSLKIIESPIRGRRGNREFLVLVRNDRAECDGTCRLSAEIIEFLEHLD